MPVCVRISIQKNRRRAGPKETAGVQANGLHACMSESEYDVECTAGGPVCIRIAIQKDRRHAGLYQNIKSNVMYHRCDVLNQHVRSKKGPHAGRSASEIMSNGLLGCPWCFVDGLLVWGLASATCQLV